MFTGNRRKGQKGFTLIEVIVIAVIVAALAAVAIPLYLGYINSSRKNSAANAAGSAASFCGACVNSGGIVGDTTSTTGGGSLGCSNNPAKIIIPDDIVLKLLPGPPRAVKGWHKEDSTGTTTFNY